MTTEYSWTPPAGFAPFRADEINDLWLAGFLDRYVPGDPDSPVRSQIAAVVNDCASHDEQPASWAIILSTAERGVEVVGLAEIAFTDPVDVDDLTLRWQQDIAAGGTSRTECLFLGSKRSPAGIRRTVELQQRGTVAHYIEEGVIVKTWPRMGVTGVIRVTASSLVTFPDLMEALRTFAHEFEIKEMAGATR